MGFLIKVAYWGMAIQLALFILVSLPLPGPIRRLVVSILGNGKVSKNIWKIHRIFLIVIVCVFLSSIFGMRKNSNLLSWIHDQEEQNATGLTSQEITTQINLYKEQRDFYLAGLFMIISFAINRYCSLLETYTTSEKNIKQLQKAK